MPHHNDCKPSCCDSCADHWDRKHGHHHYDCCKPKSECEYTYLCKKKRCCKPKTECEYTYLCHKKRCCKPKTECEYTYFCKEKCGYSPCAPKPTCCSYDYDYCEPKKCPPKKCCYLTVKRQNGSCKSYKSCHH